MCGVMKLEINMIFKLKSKYAREIASNLMSKYQAISPATDSKRKTGKEIVDALDENRKLNLT